MDALFVDFALAYKDGNGYTLASTISPQPPASDPARLYSFLKSTNTRSIQTDLRYKLQYNPDFRLDKTESDTWLEIFTNWFSFIVNLVAAEELQNVGKPNDADWTAVYETWKEVVVALAKGYNSAVLEAWTLPCIYVAAKYLRIFAIKADVKIASQRDGGLAFGSVEGEDAFDPNTENQKLEDATRAINRLFGLCINDRSPIESSRKWGAYNISNLLFKTYFKLNNVSLCKNILRSLQATSIEMPALQQFPRADQVTFQYYNGVLAFLEEDYASAESFLTSAYEMCHKNATTNIELILTYLIPTRMLTLHQLPTHKFLSQYPNLERRFGPVRDAIRRGDLQAFNAAMEQGEDEFVKRRIYLTLERGRDLIIRNLFRKVFVAGGFEEQKEGETGPPVRRTRRSIKEFAAALHLAGAEIGDGEGGIDIDEVECLMANNIYRGFMKGYIARERGMIVLSKAGAFPGTGV